MKKYIFIISVLGILFAVFSFAFAQKNNIEIIFFYSPTCTHCAEEWKFLKELNKKYPEIKINRLSVFDRENVELLQNLYKDYNVLSEYYGMVPVTFTNERYFVGFNEEIARNIEDCIIVCRKDKISKGEVTIIDLEGNISLPIIGKFNIKKYSLSALAVILGTLDGFNVCSLGALVLILGLVLSLKSRLKTLIFGGLFILTTAIVYGFLIGIWYQIFSLILPYLRLMQFLIGLLGVAGGIYFLREFLKFKKQGPTCQVGKGKEIISKFSLKFQKSLRESRNILVLVGLVLLFAAIITIIEFPCSAAVPVVFAGILSQSHLPGFYYLLYISLFLLFYMLDEIIVFLIAFFTLTLWLASRKAMTWITLAESIILFLLGLYYLLGFGAFL